MVLCNSELCSWTHSDILSLSLSGSASFLDPLVWIVLYFLDRRLFPLRLKPRPCPFRLFFLYQSVNNTCCAVLSLRSSICSLCCSMSLDLLCPVPFCFSPLSFPTSSLCVSPLDKPLDSLSSLSPNSSLTANHVYYLSVFRLYFFNFSLFFSSRLYNFCFFSIICGLSFFCSIKFCSRVNLSLASVAKQMAK